MSNLVYIILTVVLIVIIIIFSNYNKMIKLINRVKKSKANIEIILNKRFDLIPNLVECVKSYSKHEKETLNDIVSLRSRYKDEKNMSIKKAEEMNNELTRYLITIESYPELKANENFLSLQNELRSIEDELSNVRIRYNDEVNKYNTCIESVPTNIIASIFGFKKARWFQIDEDKKENIDINNYKKTKKK